MRIFDGTAGDCGGDGASVLFDGVRDDCGDCGEDADVWRSSGRLAEYDLCDSLCGRGAAFGAGSDWAISGKNLSRNEGAAGVYCAENFGRLGNLSDFWFVVWIFGGILRKGGILCYNSVMVPSSSGLGRLVLIQKIAGSTPAGITMTLEGSLEGGRLLDSRRGCFATGRITTPAGITTGRSTVGSARRLGRRGRRFKSCRPDHTEYKARF